jgi:hypothetical protein
MTMRAILFAVLSIAVSTAVAVFHAKAQTALPEISVSPLPPKNLGLSPPGAGAGSGNDKKQEGGSLDRLNKQLKRTVDETNPTENTPPIDARSSDLKTGVVNMPGVQQQYGKNFGHSVYPYRPAAPVYTSPLGRR